MVDYEYLPLLILLILLWPRIEAGFGYAEIFKHYWDGIRAMIMRLN